MNLVTLSLVSLLICASGYTRASIHVYDRDPFREVGNAYLVSGGSEGLAASRTPNPLPRHTDPVNVNDGRSYIRFQNITFRRSEASAAKYSKTQRRTGLVQVIIFEAADRDNIGGSPYGGQRSICCTPDLAKVEGCKQGEVIRIPSARDSSWPVTVNVYFRGKSLTAQLKTTEAPISKTGMYNLFFISCDSSLKGMTMSGQTSWKGPDGYLPGRMAPLKKFYVIMAIAYALLCVAWFSQYVRFWDDVLQLQHCISVVVGVGLFEMILWYFDYAYFNNTGTRPVALTTWVVTVGAARRTVSRLLMLCVSMGYGVVRPTLGGLTTKVMLIGVTYFLSTELLNITEYVGAISDIAGRARVILVLPNALLDAFLIMWIFTSLSKTLTQLQAKRSSVKLDTYRKFSNALLITVILAVVWIGYEVYFKATDPFNEKWQSAWIITAFWDILAFALLCVICYLWAPSQTSQRYAYSEERGEDSDGEESEALYSGTPKGDIGLVKQERREKNGQNEDEFDLDEDDGAEEGKRE
ncbi:lung seven transmembrane receptor family protein [Artemisia annua]|uniref:Lung seven transmembrane receptor family protein n=1 Tax=Artemisia annua TaxID=35608 RepID=A0A2U1LY94_ARTAN|nr:lung seven transmembrane receptor family protein [Artemisia annua]